MLSKVGLKANYFKSITQRARFSSQYTMFGVDRAELHKGQLDKNSLQVTKDTEPLNKLDRFHQTNKKLHISLQDLNKDVNAFKAKNLEDNKDYFNTLANTEERQRVFSNLATLVPGEHAEIDKIKKLINKLI